MAQTKTIDITPARIKLPVIEVSQFDIGRPIIIHMKDGAEWYDLTGLTVKLQGTKPSGFGYSVTGTVDGHDVTFSTIYDMTSESGFILSEVSIIDGTDVIGSQNVMLHVEASPHPPEIVDGSPETILPEMRELVNRAEAAAEILLDCSAIATTLPTGASATASYSPETGVFSFGLPRGAKGETGATGETGNGISNIRKTSTSGLVDTYTITYTDGTSTTFTVTNGQNGTGSVADVTQNGVSVLDGTVAKVVADANVQSDWNESDSTDDAYIKNKPALATVATTGDYDDLSNKPDVATVVELTQAQYDALTPAEKNNGTIYCVTDSTGTYLTASEVSYGAGSVQGALDDVKLIGGNGSAVLFDANNPNGFLGAANGWDSSTTNYPTYFSGRLGAILTFPYWSGIGEFADTFQLFVDEKGNVDCRKRNGTTWKAWQPVGGAIVLTTTVSSLPRTITDSRITSDMVCTNAELSTASVQLHEWTVTTSDGSLTLSGAVNGYTGVTLYLTRKEN